MVQHEDVSRYRVIPQAVPGVEQSSQMRLVSPQISSDHSLFAIPPFLLPDFQFLCPLAEVKSGASVVASSVYISDEGSRPDRGMDYWLEDFDASR